ncbi:hypothetical protein [Christiangramia forsetii]|nr:hypothetical protein [Christiangramia forsetii]
MKKFNFYTKIFMLISIIFILSCTQDEIRDDSVTDELEGIYLKNPQLPEDPNILVEILPHFDKNGSIDGYYYYDQPFQIFSLEKIEAIDSDLNKISATITSLVGDRDNFGYGGTAGPPCKYYNLSTPEDNVGNFDRLIRGSVDLEKTWVHDFRADPLFCSAFVAEEVTIGIREYFNDDVQTITIEIDGEEMNFVQNGISRCQYPIIQTFKFVGESASFANDGLINISVKENGEEVALDYSLVTVKGHCDNIVITGCDTGVPNQTLLDGTKMEDAILALEVGVENHGDFVKAVTELINQWKKDNLISGEEKELIMDCAGDSSIGK